MNSRVSEILAEIHQLEDELEAALKTHEARFYYKIEGATVRFEESARAAHKKLKTSIIKWLRHSNPLNVLTAPVIYAMVVPFALLDFSVSIYQAVCFRIYGLPRVRRGRYIVFDRHKLSYLNAIEKLNCLYCSYANGVIAYSREIAARTEQYWCPIKHAHKVLDPHRRYARFIDYGESATYRERFQAIRDEINQEASADPTTRT